MNRLPKVDLAAITLSILFALVVVAFVLFKEG